MKLEDIRLIDFVARRVEESDANMCYIDTLEDLQDDGFTEDDLKSLKHILNEDSIRGYLLANVITIDDNDALVCGFSYAPGAIFLAHKLEEHPIVESIDDARERACVHALLENASDASAIGMILYVLDTLRVDKNLTQHTIKTYPELAIHLTDDGESDTENLVANLIAIRERPDVENKLNSMLFGFDDISDVDYLLDKAMEFEDEIMILAEALRIGEEDADD